MAESPFWAIGARDIIGFLILIATIVAIWRGPIVAIRIAQVEQQKADRLRMKSEIYANLMRTRRVQLDPIHVMSLNLIQVYFNDVQEVLDEYTKYIKLLSRSMPERNIEHFLKEQDDKFIDLIHEIAASLGVRHDKRDLEDLAYLPNGWVNNLGMQGKLQSLFIDVLEGKRSIPISAHPSQSPQSNFPPPPTDY